MFKKIARVRVFVPRNYLASVKVVFHCITLLKFRWHGAEVISSLWFLLFCFCDISRYRPYILSWYMKLVHISVWCLLHSGFNCRSDNWESVVLCSWPQLGTWLCLHLSRWHFTSLDVPLFLRSQRNGNLSCCMLPSLGLFVTVSDLLFNSQISACLASKLLILDRLVPFATNPHQWGIFTTGLAQWIWLRKF